jgi:hypothetical protein
MVDWMDEIEESRQALFEMPGRKALVNLRVLVRSSRILAGNSHALLTHLEDRDARALLGEIGRASCRERV